MSRSLRAHVTPVYVAFVALVGLSFGSTTFVSSKQADDGLNINLAGRQRMLSQKMSKEALMYSQSVSRGANAAELERNAERVRASMEVFATTLAALKDGGEAPLDVDQTEFASLSGATSSRIAAQLGVVQAKWEPFAANIERVLTSGGADTAAMDYVMENNGDILASMNAAVTMMQADADARVTQLLVLQLALLVLGLGLVAYGWLSIRRSVARPLQDLANVAEHLAEGKLDADIPKQDVAELAELAGSFDRMRNELNTTITNLEATARQNAGLAKEAEEATQAKSEFLASMSHEIRTPMNGIIGMADLLAQSSLNDEQKHMLRTIRESGDALISVINDILDFSKIEAGRLDLEDVSMSIADALEGVAGTLTPNAAKKGVRIHTFVDPVIPASVEGDPVRVRQILFNLLGNAVKFSDKKDVSVSARLLDREEANHLWVRFEIVDQGIGISAENQAKLFQAFSQAESSTTRKFGGTGLGLAISKRLVELMGGDIGVTSEVGAGSTFWVEVPLKGAAPPRSDEKKRDLAGVHVLFVGPPGPRRDAMTRYLEFWGADFSVVDDEAHAVGIVSKPARGAPLVDVVILDLDLDRKRQAEALRLLRSGRKKKDTKIPFIVLQDFQHRGARVEGEDLVTLDANPLVRYRFVTAVAVAVGRASPEVKKDEGAFKIEVAKAPTVDEARAQGRLILLAEDNPTNQDVIRRQLNLLGYACEIANDGALALEAWRRGGYALLLTDCHMPEMDGYELTTAIRADEKNHSRPRSPIVAITANALEGEAQRCLAVGMDDFVSKPVAMPALLAALNKWMPQAAGKETKPKVAATPPARSNGGEGNGRQTAVNDRAIKDMFGDDDTVFKEILTNFVEPSEAIVADILKAATEKRAGDVKDAAHKLKSSARSIGADALADTCAALEAAGKREDWQEIEALAPTARTQMGEVLAYISAL